MKISEVIDRLLDYHPHLEGYQGCDEYKCGDPEQECTGVIKYMGWEELGMKHAAEYLTDLVQGEIPVYYVPTGDAFSYV